MQDQAAVLFFYIRRIARKATIPPVTSFIMNNNILGSIVPHNVIYRNKFSMIYLIKFSTFNTQKVSFLIS